MLNLRPFQIALLGGFGAFALFGIIFFMTFQGGSGDPTQNYGERVVIWGTQNTNVVYGVIDSITAENKDFGVVSYVQKDARTFDLELLNAIAEGRSPDLIILSSDALVLHRAKLLAINNETLPTREYRDTYVDGAEIFLLPDGAYGIPFAVDPLVMYWNRDVFSSNGLATSPKTWEELVSVVTPAITAVTQDRRITRSAVAFGEYANVRNAKEILALLFLQSGTDMVRATEQGYQITLTQGAGTGAILPPADAVLSFYTQFSLPSAPAYSWNRSLAEDRSRFAGGDLGLYFGFGSEYAEIARLNPNLNFDTTQVPQGAGASTIRGYGTFYAFAIPRASVNPQGAYAVARTLGAQDVARTLAQGLSMAPVHRAELGAGTSSAYLQVLYRAALTARTWLDPNPSATDGIFRTMVEDVTSGRARINEVITDTVGRLQLLF